MSVVIHSPESSDFIRRTIRGVLVVSFAYAVLGVANAIVQFVANRNVISGPAYSSAPGTGGVVVLNHILLLIGAAGLWKWKRWGRTLLLLWAPIDIVLMIGSLLIRYIQFAQSYIPLTTRTVGGISLREMGWYMFWSSAIHCAFPVLMLILLLPREVANLWASSPGGGFEVIPMATALPPDAQAK